MAQPVPFHTPNRDPREALRARIERAPYEHAEAIVAAYDLLQLLHDRGFLEIGRAALAAGDSLLDMAVDAADTPEVIRSTRDLLFLQGALSRIEPGWVQGVVQAIPDGLTVAVAQQHEPVSFWRILRRAFSRDSLRGLTAAINFLESFGRHLHSLEASGQKSQPAKS